MAKNKHPLLRLSGTLAGFTFVNSKTYGKHVRTPRGTYKKAAVNNTLAKNAGQAKIINGTAKVVHDYIISISGNFKQSGLWRVLLRRLRKAPEKGLADLLKSTEGLEVNSKYPLGRRLVIHQLDITVSKVALRLELVMDHHPSFASVVKEDGYYYIVHLLWLNKAGEYLDCNRIETEWVHINDAPPSYTLSFSRPGKSCYYLVLLEVLAGEQQRVVEQFEAQGMRVVAVGMIS